MAKPMNDALYRKLDVDQYDPDQFDDTEEADTPGIGPDEAQVRQLLQSSRLNEALKAALANPPLKTKNQDVKDKATTLVAKVLTSYKTSEIEAAVSQLSLEEADLLMKYIYKGMELLPDGQTCGLLLAWHAQVFTKCGHGGIIRVFSDRKRL
ncbi:Protein ARX-7 [Aphelenchoides avenae]|nr:Protein ARX-7 [Aphelenchus avenae]